MADKTTNIERQSNTMFPTEGTSVVNVKFFLGNNRSVTGAKLANQLARADAQLSTNTTSRVTQLDGHLTTTTI